MRIKALVSVSYNTGVTYFVYGENIDVYSGTIPLFKEFMEAGLDYIESIGWIILALPVYRIYPTKAYRKYKRVVRRMQRAGRFTIILSDGKFGILLTIVSDRVLLARLFP